MIILYCINTLWAGGGIEHITIAKANSLASVEGNMVLLAVADNRFPPVRLLEPRVRVVDLGLSYYIDEDKRSRFSNLLHIWKQSRLHKKKLKEVLCTINPDIIVSTDSFGKRFLPSLRTNKHQVFIREYHLWTRFHSFTSRRVFEKIFGGVIERLDALFSLKYDKIVVLTQEEKDYKWKNIDKVCVVPNPISRIHSFKSPLNNKTVSAAGRLCHQKNFDLLIDSWQLVNRLHPDWTLEIWGDGPDKWRLNQKINDLHLIDCIFLRGYDNNLISKLSTSSVFVLSSLYEGMPLVILEAMSCGVPVVSTSCPCGPKDIISDGKNGFLVPLNDAETLAERICRLIEDPDLRKQMGLSAFESSRQYSMERITTRWMALFEELLAERQK